MALVLVVDDDPTIQQLVKVNLELDGHEVVTAGDGRDAIEQIREARPDIVVCDVMMPEIDGVEVCRTIKADAALNGTPVILLTARAQERDRVRGEEAGADAYVTKPFDPLALSDLIAELLES